MINGQKLALGIIALCVLIGRYLTYLPTLPTYLFFFFSFCFIIIVIRTVVCYNYYYNNIIYIAFSSNSSLFSVDSLRDVSYYNNVDCVLWL